MSLLMLLMIDLRAADAIPGEELCNRPVGFISFVGNDVTRPPVLLRELSYSPGDPCRLDDVIDGIQSIMDLGLFKSVYATMALRDGRLDVQYVLSEKFFFLAIPRLSRTSEGELRLGLQLRWDNFLGRLHQLRLTSEKRQEDDGQGRSGFVHKLNYDVPRLFNSSLGFSVGVSSERKQALLSDNGVEYGEVVRESDIVSLSVSRWLSASNGVSGLRVFAGVRLQDRHFDLQEGDLGPFTDGLDIGVFVGAENRARHVGRYRRTGSIFGGSVGVSSSALGSDFQYHAANVYLRRYIPLSGGLRNLNVHARIGVSDGAPFGEQSFHIGGGERLRGLDPGSRGGDVLTLLNLEYLSALYRWPRWRWVLFADVGNVYPRQKIRLLRQRARGGFGLRYKIEALTNTDLRIDLAWDPDRDRLQSYVGTRLTF